jgi:hypothetical protein
MRPLTDDDIILDGADGSKIVYDITRAAHHTVSSVQHAEFWLADVRWFALRTLPIALTATAFSIVAISYDSDTWIVLLLQLCIVFMLLATWIMVMARRLLWYRIAFYFVLVSLMCNILVLILWLAVYARDLLHTKAWIWWTLSAVVILEVLVFVSLLIALASLVSCGLVVHHSMHNAADMRVVEAAQRFVKAAATTTTMNNSAIDDNKKKIN